MRHGHAQGAGEGLEDGFGLVVVVVAAGRDLEVAPRGACERVEEVAEHFGRNVADPLAAERGVPLEVDAAPEVEEHQRPAVVHRQGEAVAGDPGLRAQRAVDGLAQRDGHVLHRVVFVDVQIAPRVDGQRDAAVVGDLREHVVEEAQARGDLAVEVAAAVEVDDPLVEVPSATPTDIERRIGNHIAELIPDGATLQIGVGGIPNAVLAALTGHKHLGLHTEAMTDGVLPLLKSGVIDNSLKRVMPGVTVASLALGSRRLYDYMDYRKDLVMKDVAWTNDPFRIRENPRVMAINSAVEVDLTGQVCADSVGERIISGVGGQHDFMYGGALSEGGKTFIAIPSTTPKGESKIKALLTPGAGVVTTRHMVQHIVTEYGVAHLRGRNLAQRARALIAVAHPSVREELEKAACERFGYSFLRLK